jgi:hypothetical protein
VRRARKLRPLIATAVASGFVFASAAEAKQFAYEPNFDTNTGVAALSVGASGALATLPGSPFATGGENVEGLAITADAKRLYTASVATPPHILGFTINADGTLAPIPGATKVIGATPTASPSPQTASSYTSPTSTTTRSPSSRSGATAR